MGLAGIAGSEIVLTWFGVGIQPPHPSFGAMIYDASSVRTINAHLYLLAFPAGIVTVLLFCVQPARRRADGHLHAQGALAVDSVS